MGVINIAPGDNLRTAFADARPGDTITILPGRYSVGGEIKTPPQVTIRAAGWNPGMSMMPEAADGLPVMIEGRLTIGPSCALYGIGVDSSTTLSASGTVLIDGNENHIYDLYVRNRSAAGVGSIAVTIGVPPGFGGRGPASDFILDGFQIANYGTPGSTKHQGLYDKTTRGAKIRNGIVRGGPMFGLHLYPDSQGAEYERIIVDRCGAGIVFSSAPDSSTGLVDPRTSGAFVHHVAITNPTRLGNYCLESWWGGTSTPPVACRFEDSILYAGQGAGSRIKPSLAFVSTARVTNADPGYRDPDRGDYRVAAASPAADKVPVWLVEGAVPTTPPPPPPPPPPPSVDPRDAQTADLTAQLAAANNRLGALRTAVAAETLRHTQAVNDAIARSEG